jgi:hypothetical protein
VGWYWAEDLLEGEWLFHLCCVSGRGFEKPFERAAAQSASRAAQGTAGNTARHGREDATVRFAEEREIRVAGRAGVRHSGVRAESSLKLQTVQTVKDPDADLCMAVRDSRSRSRLGR